MNERIRIANLQSSVYIFDTMLDSRYRDKSGRRPMPPYVRKLETDARKVQLHNLVPR